eukprot:1211669-Amphidinium_carterae.1
MGQSSVTHAVALALLKSAGKAWVGRFSERRLGEACYPGKSRTARHITGWTFLEDLVGKFLHSHYLNNQGGKKGPVTATSKDPSTKERAEKTTEKNRLSFSFNF